MHDSSVMLWPISNASLLFKEIINPRAHKAPPVYVRFCFAFFHVTLQEKFVTLLKESKFCTSTSNTRQ